MAITAIICGAIILIVHRVSASSEKVDALKNALEIEKIQLEREKLEQKLLNTRV